MIITVIAAPMGRRQGIMSLHFIISRGTGQAAEFAGNARQVGILGVAGAGPIRPESLIARLTKGTCGVGNRMSLYRRLLSREPCAS